jgi:hypothetical protein
MSDRCCKDARYLRELDRCLQCECNCERRLTSEKPADEDYVTALSFERTQQIAH